MRIFNVTVRVPGAVEYWAICAVDQDHAENDAREKGGSPIPGVTIYEIDRYGVQFCHKAFI